jgi:hypothetical protein
LGKLKIKSKSSHIRRNIKEKPLVDFTAWQSGVSAKFGAIVKSTVFWFFSADQRYQRQKIGCPG